MQIYFTTILWLSPSYIYILFVPCVCIHHVIPLFLFSFICTFTRSCLRPWVCMLIYRSYDITLRGGLEVPRRTGWAAVGLFMTFLSLWLEVCSIIVFFFCYICLVIYVQFHRCADGLICTLFLALYKTVLCILLTCDVYNISSVLSLFWYLYRSTVGLTCMRS